jgi:hypothetical protein
MYIIFIFIIIVICFTINYINTNTSLSYAQPCVNLCPNPGPRGVQYKLKDGKCEIVCMPGRIPGAGTPVGGTPSSGRRPGGSRRPVGGGGGGGSGSGSGGIQGGGGGIQGGGNPGGIICPVGQRLKGNKCVPITTSGFDISKCKGLGMDECKQKLKQPGPSSCQPDQVIFNNVCVNPQNMCVPGLTWDNINKKCVAPPQKCLPGYVLGSNGCVKPGETVLQCPLGSMVKNGKCEVVACSVVGQTVQNGQCVCPAGQIPKNGVCVSGGPNECQNGQILINGQCVAPQTCPLGSMMKNGKCEVVACSVVGQTVQNGQCVCPTGQIPQNGRCVASGVTGSV